MARRVAARAPKPTYPTCVRQLTPRKDAKFRQYYLCDDCSDRWTNDAFDGNAPLHVCGSHMGYCLLCNQVRNDIRARTWFLCDICAHPHMHPGDR